MEDHEIPSGWPLGLEAMNTRLRVGESVKPMRTSAVEHYSLHAPSPSFSSFSSSDLDTESTTSFFQDHSVSLGRLIGIKRSNSGRLYFPNSIGLEEHDRVSRMCLNESNVSKGQGINICQGICVPLLFCATMKTSGCKSKAGS